MGDSHKDLVNEKISNMWILKRERPWEARRGEPSRVQFNTLPHFTFVTLSVSIDNVSGSQLGPNTHFQSVVLNIQTEWGENNYRKCREEKNSQVSIMVSWYAVTKTNKTIINSIIIRNLPRQSMGLPRNVIWPHPKMLDFLICHWLEDTNLQIRAIPASSGLLLILTLLMDGRIRLLHREQS